MTIKRLTILILIAALLTGPRISIAQSDSTPERLLYGDSITRSFKDEIGVFLFSFNAQQSDSVTITMVAQGDPVIDPVLALLGPDGQTVAQNDDSLDDKFGVLNARLVNFPIPEAGTYTIRATRGGQGAPTGDFTLSLRGRRNGEARGSVNFGQSATGKISTDNPSVTYEFRAARGDVVSGQVHSTDDAGLSPTLTLLDPNGVKLSDVSAATKTPGTAALPRTLIADDGIYSLVIAASKGGGGFALALNRDLQATFMAYGDSDDGEITSSATTVNYVFQGKAGELVTISLFKKSGNLDPLLMLTNLDGKTLITNDNATGKDLQRNDARISRFKLPATGVYVIVAGRSGGAKGTTKGKFTLALDVVKVAP